MLASADFGWGYSAVNGGLGLQSHSRIFHRIRRASGCLCFSATVPSLALLLIPAMLQPARGQAAGSLPQRSVANLVEVPANPGTMDVANRLPLRIGGWLREAPAASMGVAGIFVKYRLPSVQVWATIALHAGTQRRVEDGPDAAQVLHQRPELDIRSPGSLAFLQLVIPGAPEQRCTWRTALTSSNLETIDYTCGTGVAGQALISRVTAQSVPLGAENREAVHEAVGFLLVGVTRAAVSADPPIPARPAGQTQQEYLASMRLIPVQSLPNHFRR